MMTDFQDIRARATEIRALYAGIEQKKYGRSWSRQDAMMGFVGDVGALAKIVMAQEGLRDMPDKDEKLKHELSDCLWCLLVLADSYGIDLEKEFFTTMEDIEKRIKT